jgi:hypothetical protein
LKHESCDPSFIIIPAKARTQRKQHYAWRPRLSPSREGHFQLGRCGAANSRDHMLPAGDAAALSLTSERHKGATSSISTSCCSGAATAQTVRRSEQCR